MITHTRNSMESDRAEMLAAQKAQHRRAQITIIASAIAALAIFTAAIEFISATT